MSVHPKLISVAFLSVLLSFLLIMVNIPFFMSISPSLISGYVDNFGVVFSPDKIMRN